MGEGRWAVTLRLVLPYGRFKLEWLLTHGVDSAELVTCPPPDTTNAYVISHVTN